MKYARAYIDPDTGEIVHMVASNAALTHDYLGEAHTFHTEDLEVEEGLDGQELSVHDLRARLEVRGGRVEPRATVPVGQRPRIRARGPRRTGPAPRGPRA